MTSNEDVRKPPRSTSLVNVAVWILQLALAAYLVIFSALSMFTGDEHITETIDRVGLGQWLRYFTATVEVAGAIGLLIPMLCGLAALGLMGVMVGAIITELSVRTPAGAVLPAILLVLFAVVAWYRWPQTKALADRALRRD
jgi:putative oxidoreductase